MRLEYRLEDTMKSAGQHQVPRLYQMNASGHIDAEDQHCISALTVMWSAMSQHITAQAYITNSGPSQRQPYGFADAVDLKAVCTCRSPPPSAFCCGTGEDFDMAEYEVLRFDQRDSEGSPSEATSASEPDSSPVTPSLTPLFLSPSTPCPPSPPSPPPTPPAPERPEEVGGRGAQAASSSPQLRLAKRKAPEVHVLVHVAAQLLPASLLPLPLPSAHTPLIQRAVTYSPLH